MGWFKQTQILLGVFFIALPLLAVGMGMAAMAAIQLLDLIKEIFRNGLF